MVVLFFFSLDRFNFQLEESGGEKFRSYNFFKKILLVSVEASLIVGHQDVNKLLPLLCLPPDLDQVLIRFPSIAFFQILRCVYWKYSCHHLPWLT